MIKRQIEQLSMHYIHSDVSKALQKEWSEIAIKSKEAKVLHLSTSMAKKDDKQSEAREASRKFFNHTSFRFLERPETPSIFLPSKERASRSSPDELIPFYRNCIIVEGFEGLSLESTADAYKAEVQKKKRRIRSYFVEAIEGDDISPYGIIRKIFYIMVKDKLKTNFDSEFEQRRVLKDLLRKSSPKAVRAEVEQDLKELEVVLDLQWAEEIDIDDIASEKTPADDIAKSDGFTTTEDRSPLLDIFRALLMGTCNALVVENAHYCDELTWTMFEYLLNIEGVNLAIFITLFPFSRFNLGRDGMAPNSFTKGPNPLFDFSEDFEPVSYRTMVENRKVCDFVSLKSLSKDDVSNLVCEVLGIKTIKESLLDAIYEVSQANPIWCLEIATFINDRGTDDFLKRISNTKSQNPLKALITYRYDQLSPIQQTVLKYASVIGDKFSFRTLLSIIPVQYDLLLQFQRSENLRADSLLMNLEGLCQLGFIHFNSQTNLYIFQHELVRDTIYQQWPPSLVAVVHGAVASYIENNETPLQAFYPRYSSSMSSFRMLTCFSFVDYAITTR